MGLLFRVCVTTALIAACHDAVALVIDDFTEGPMTLTGPGDPMTQPGLSTDRVVGGSRTIEVTRGPEAFELTIENGTFSAANPDPADDWGYFQLMYGYETPLGVDFTAGGHDRLRLRFGSFDATGLPPIWVSVNTELPPFGSAPGPEYRSIPHDGGVFEIPFTAYPDVDFSNVSTFAIQLSRMSSVEGFTLEEVVTAGPPIPGDYDRDGLVDELDLIQWNNFYVQTSNRFLGTLLGPDGNGNFRVDAADYTVWRDAYDATLAAQVSVPEPTSIVLGLMLGGVAVASPFRTAKS